MNLRTAGTALLLALGAACSSAPTRPLTTVVSVDLQRYLGTWYEIALLPNRFQAVCVADTQAHYSLDDGDIKVRNRCHKADGTVEEAIGIAKVVPDTSNAKLRVSFFRPFYGNYWVLALGPDYSWVLVGEPGREYGWVLSRTPQLPAAALDTALSRASELGFDRKAFRTTPQAHAIE